MARRDSWQVSVLDRDEREKGIHLQARAGRLAWSTFRSVAGAGSLEATNVEGIDWFTDRIRITHVDGDQATAQFRQHYVAGSLNTTTRKTLSLHREKGQWRILRETTGG